jgi:hypothetical protein
VTPASSRAGAPAVEADDVGAVPVANLGADVLAAVDGVEAPHDEPQRPPPVPLEVGLVALALAPLPGPPWRAERVNALAPEPAACFT